MKHVYTSAKTSEGIEELFTMAVHELNGTDVTASSIGVPLRKKKAAKPKSEGCCQ